MSVLHLIDAASPQACPTTLALLAATAAAEPGAKVVLIGGSRLERAAEAAALREAVRVDVPMGRAELGLVQLYQRLRRRAGNEGAPSVVHAWSAGALRVARWLWPRTPRVACLVQPPDAAIIRAIRRDAVRSSARGMFAVAAFDPVVAASVRAQCGVSAFTSDDGESHAGARPAQPDWAPGWRDQSTRGEARLALRQRWRCEQMEAGELVVALLGDPPEAADAREGLLLIGLVREALAARFERPPNMALLVHPRQRRRMLAERTIRRVGRTPLRLIQDGELAAPWRVLPGCDVAVSLDDAGAGLALLAALAAGVPVVAPDTPRHRLHVTSESTGEATGLLAATAELRHMAGQLQRLVEDPALGARLGAAASRSFAADPSEAVARWLATLGDALAATGAANRAADHGEASPLSAATP